MLPGSNGSLRLGCVSGVTVYVHWTWFLLAAMAVELRPAEVTAAVTLVTLMSVFGIVLLHEFGHALACRSVGGRADRIVLWPLGGVAFVQPPARPGALLWSIIAGPLVNLILIPVLTVLLWLSSGNGAGAWHKTRDVLELLWSINLALLVFNMLPVYPLDGGQTLQAILWFMIGRVRSLRVSAVIGLIVGVAAAGLMLFWKQEFWLALIAVFVVMRSWQGLRMAKVMAAAEAMGYEVEER
ncbi:MAG: site-2 protease family protein [Phycisphaeraceae bacterium]|nr:site-2 protease family protein [Phycisphaeraceae bacterium]